MAQAVKLNPNADDKTLICLEIMARGEDLLAIGVWEAPLKRAAMRGWCDKIGNGYRITDEGRAFLAKETGEAIDGPELPDWIVNGLPDGSLVVLRRDDTAVSGYVALGPPRRFPIVHGQTNQPDTVMLRDGVDGFLQAVLDLAWARGMRPKNAQ